MIGDLGEYSRVVNEKYKTVVIIERVKEQDLFKLTGYCTHELPSEGLKEHHF